MVQPVLTLLLIVTLLILLVAVPASAQMRSSARSVAMAGAHMGLAKGVDAARYNPANLGLTDYRVTGIDIVSVGTNISNNAFTLSDYNAYNGAFLTSDDKNDILDKIPAEGLKLDARAEVTAGSFASGPFAVTVTGVGVADINLSRDIFELILNGNTVADTIDVSGSFSDAVSYATLGLSYGQAVYSRGNRQLAIGATLKYIRGLYTEQIVELEGLAATELTGFAGEGKAVAQTAEGGSGVGLDLGAALQLNRSYTVGLAVTNVFGTIHWSNSPKEYGYVFHFDTLNLDNMGDDWVVSDDYERDIDEFSTRLPRELTAGIAKTSGSLLWAFDWRQGLEDKPGISTTPRLAAGLEYSSLPFLPLRAGFAFGGGESPAFSFGTGVHTGPAQLDLALVTGNALPGYNAKSANVAVSLGLYF
jgi:hypothetical protein